MNVSVCVYVCKCVYMGVGMCEYMYYMYAYIYILYNNTWYMEEEKYMCILDECKHYW